MFSLAFITFHVVFLAGVIDVTLCQESNCEEIDEAILEYFGNGDYNFTLYAMLGYDMTGFLDKTKNYQGEYDINNKEERLEFACKLADSENHRELTETLDETLGEGFSDALLSPISDEHRGLGSLKKVEALADEFLALLEWADRSHYPFLPIKSDRKDTIQMFMDVKVMSEKQRIDMFLDQFILPMPVLLRPVAATKLVEESRSYEDLDKGMDLDGGTMEAAADRLKKLPNGVKYLINDIKRFLDLLEALNATGSLV